MTYDDIRAAAARLTASGQPWELADATIDGVAFRVFRNAPENLRELYRSSLAFADRDFYVFEDERYTFADAWNAAARVAVALQRHGVRPGDRVGIAMRNYPEWIFAFMGITCAGAITVAMNGWWTREELEYGLDDSGARLLFADAERLERLAGRLRSREVAAVGVRLPADRARALDAIPWERFVPAQAEQMPDVTIPADTNASIIYTSGSTAHPKGVLATHRSIIHAVFGWECGAVIAADLFPGLVDPNPEFPPAMILSVPLFHVSGLNVQLMSSYRGGRKLVGMYKWDPEKALQLIEAERITQFNGVPTMSWEMVQSPNFRTYDLRSLKTMGGGGAAMPPEHSRQISSELASGVPGTGYGMTETNGLATSISGADLLARPRSCGRPIPPIVEIRVVDDAGVELARGEQGEIWIRGPMNFRGYWKNPAATKETMSDGWVHSGDIGYMDEERFVFITDRKKDMVIRGGENIGCQEVEAVIYDHPDVSECAVFGVPDDRLGEALAAVVVPKPDRSLDAAAIQAHVAAHLAKFKVPERVWVRTERLPRIASEKIYKRGIREEALRMLRDEGETKT